MPLLRSMTTALVLLGMSSGASLAGVITGGSLLDAAGANQLEEWLGSGDLDFTNVYSGVAGDYASEFHAAVDGVGPTFSIYEIEFTAGGTALIGGYTRNDWGAKKGIGAYGVYVADPTAFIFNLTTGEVQFKQRYPQFATYIGSYYFPRFGRWDLAGSLVTLGRGYTYSLAYDPSQGSIAYAGDSGSGWPRKPCSPNCFTIKALEVYTFADARPVPEPASMALLGLGLAGLGLKRRKRTD